MPNENMDKLYKNNILSEEKRQQMWLSDLCVKYGEISITPSVSSLSSSCYSGTESATDFEIDQILLGSSEQDSDCSSWIDTASDTASSYEYYWSKSNTG